MATDLPSELVYSRESELVNELEGMLVSSENPFSHLTTACEFNYLEGKVDLIAANDAGELFSFEAKLKRWRTAVYQAYRNTSFSHYSYVVLPMQAAQHALKRRHEFEQRGVGLCAVSVAGIKVEILAVRKTPLRPWLTSTAIAYIKR